VTDCVLHVQVINTSCCLNAAALDYRVEGVYLKISALGVGWAKLQELTKYLEYFNASGKWSCAYLDRAGEKEYFLASACQEVFVPPSGNLSLRGLAVSGAAHFLIEIVAR
jgi:protease-4